MTLRFILLTQLLSLARGIDSTDHQHLFTDSFPRNDEYDIMALDPETPYGTPYGGFSRATASRLAALPLKLPSISKEMNGNLEDTDFEPMYTTVRDNTGRQYACRIYHEDELDPDSIGDSMFDTPKLKKKGTADKQPSFANEQEKKDQVDSAATGEESLSKSDAKSVASEENVGKTNTESSSPIQLGFDPIMLGHTMQQRLAKLNGLCAQLHPNTWWSYEWCHQESIKQFHVKVNKSENGKIKKYELEDITNLGSFSGRRIEIKGEERDDEKEDAKKNNQKDLAEGRKELGRVVDTFVGGDTCPDTGKPRVTETVFRCCSKKNNARNKGGVLMNGNQLDTDIVSLYQATEDKTRVCHYNITICTSLLCDDLEDTNSATSKSSDNNSKSGSKSGSSNKKSPLNLDLDPAKAEKMTVVEILDATFGSTGDFCMRTQTGDWWAYELCPGSYVRQFHEEVNLMDQISGIVGSQKKGAVSSVTEFFLGRYKPEDHKGVTKENEWEKVVNTTSSDGSKSSNPGSSENNKKNRKSQSGPSASAGGNGSYYYQEYTKGDLCDDVDVTDSAIKAGEFGEGGIERAVTVRYSCNTELTVSVKEDSTCHYIVDVTVPTLCHHPLFKAPVSKKQVVKCLPIS
eukprot:CAMPEP_0116124598 /NCGR_PEP_ID=MMETSP0329-20121206/5363_1 /TAXON_ID=697910 /ORGANISM="Pseudo-nitzschia arenysensis, Strain B593" /LENGTH=629 /DNA_ID=CAMNT_0003618583 /DNA_START=65 /DNA_END=1954 /DNA_ORIENTATION=+